MYQRLFLLLPFLFASVGAQHLRQSSSHRRLLEQEQHQEVLDCTYVRADVHYEDGVHQDFDACSDGETLYDIPTELLGGRLNRTALFLHSGTSLLSIQGAHKHKTTDASTGDEIEATSADIMPQVHIATPDDPITTDPATLARSNTINEVPSMGRKKIIVVRVTSLDSNVTLTSDELSQSTFGTNGVSFATQMDRCSNGALTFEAAEGDGIHKGVGELQLNEVTTGVRTKNFQTPLRQLFVEKFGPEDQFHHILYCMPKGTGDKGWIAYAFRDTPFSYYHDDWCGSLTGKQHEIGHNLNLGHSGKGTDQDHDAYDDKSCVMGFSSKGMDSPQECYNGWRHWSLGWYDARKVNVDPNLVESWGGTLAAFVDYTDMTDPNDYAVINVGDLYLQYNLAEKHNWEVAEARNQITIVESGEQGDAEAPSSLLGSIDLETPVFNHNGIEIQVCEQGTKAGKIDDVRFFKISIHKQGASSACGISVTDDASPEPTPLPTMAPATSIPTMHPTILPTSKPTTLPPTQAEDESTTVACADSTSPFQINGIDVYCEILAMDGMLKDLYCRPCQVAYLECRHTCHSCDADASASNCSTLTSGTGSTIRRQWDSAVNGNT